MPQLDLTLVQKAQKYLQGKIIKTPVEFSLPLSKIAGHPVYLKLECLQITGSFKIRGALFYLSTLPKAQQKEGVACCSAGNHGLAVAFAAKEMGIPCTVFVPKSVDQAKFDKLVQMATKVRKSDSIGYDETLEWAEGEAAKENMHFVSAYDDERIMAGNGGTLAAEVIEQVPDATHFILPVGGGGLSGGFAYFAKTEIPNCRIIGCQHEGSPALNLSLDSGKAAKHLPPIETVAGGIEGELGDQCFQILKNRIDAVALLSELEIRQSVAWMLAHHQYLIEPSAGVTVAALLAKKTGPITGQTVIVLSGRNVAFKTLKSILSE